MITATLDEDNEQTAVIAVARGRTLRWTVDATALANGECRLFVSRDGRGTFRALARVSADADGRVYNDTGSDLYAYFLLAETVDPLSGSAVVTLEAEPQVVVVIRDPETDVELLELGDSFLRPLVPFDLTNVPEYADNAAALAAGADVGTAYVSSTGAVRVVQAA